MPSTPTQKAAPVVMTIQRFDFKKDDREAPVKLAYVDPRTRPPLDDDGWTIDEGLLCLGG